MREPLPIPTVSVSGVPSPLPDAVQVVDVREDVEWRHGHIEGAVHIPLHDLPGRLGEIEPGQVLVVCKVGSRSAQAVAYLRHHGHEAVNLAGGMVDWAAAGRPMVSDTGGAPQVV
jgi:rhodanese-related sulfurtransferase